LTSRSMRLAGNLLIKRKCARPRAVKSTRVGVFSSPMSIGAHY